MFSRGNSTGPADNIWVVDKGSDMILKLNPQGRVVWVFGRKGEASHYQMPPDTAATLSGLLARAGVAVTPPANNNPRNPVPQHRDGSPGTTVRESAGGGRSGGWSDSARR